MYKYPYLNRSIEDMKGEYWKPIRGYNGLFLISNLGRVKSAPKSTSGKIKAQRLYKKGELLLSFKITFNCIEKEYRTAAIVYETFIEDVNFKTHNIGYKDGNSLNLHPSNLYAYKRHQYVIQDKKLYKKQLIAATASMYKYPYQNLSLVDMEGEIWKPVADLPDYYAVSNKGRVKSLERECAARAGGLRINEARIMKQRIQISANPITKEQYHHLSVHTHINYTKREFTVSRIVYEAFIAPIDPNNLNLIVRHKDNNHLNNTTENLYLSTKSELQNNLLKTGKKHRLGGCSDLSKYTHEEWESRYDSIRKPVSQFDLDGNFIKTFESRGRAAESLGIKVTTISGVINGRIHTANGYQWRSGIDPSPMKPAKVIPEHLKRNAFKSKKVAKYDLDGHLMGVYPSVTIAARENNIKLDHLYSYIRNPERVPRKGKRYFWKYL